MDLSFLVHYLIMEFEGNEFRKQVSRACFPHLVYRWNSQATIELEIELDKMLQTTNINHTVIKYAPYHPKIKTVKAFMEHDILLLLWNCWQNGRFILFYLPYRYSTVLNYTMEISKRNKNSFPWLFSQYLIHTSFPKFHLKF